jgi:hypothetical protein
MFDPKQPMIAVTVWGAPESRVRTRAGMVSYREWCEQLATDINNTIVRGILRYAEVRENGSGKIAVFADDIASTKSMPETERTLRAVGALVRLHKEYIHTEEDGSVVVKLNLGRGLRDKATLRIPGVVARWALRYA